MRGGCFADHSFFIIFRAACFFQSGPRTHFIKPMPILPWTKEIKGWLSGRYLRARYGSGVRRIALSNGD